MGKRVIKLSELVKGGCSWFSVKDNSPRGVRSVPVSLVRVGDWLVIDNYFHEVVEG